MHRQIAGKLTGPRVKWGVLLLALVVVVLCFPFTSKIAEVESNQTSSWLPSSAESTRALTRLDAFQSENVLPTLVVYDKPDGLSDEDLAAITEQGRRIAQLDGVVGQAQGPQVSADGRAAQLQVTFDLGADGYKEMPATADDIQDIATLDGARVYVTGTGGLVADQGAVFNSTGALLGITLLVVVLILLITYRSPVLWLLPIVSALIALVASNAVVYALAKYADLTVNAQSSFILTVLVIGAGTDYALLLVARYREELRRHEDRHEAMAVALHRAAPAIIASAVTVAIGMMCLMLARMNSTAGMGPVLAVGIVVTLGVMTTVLPAMLVAVDRRVFWPFAPVYRSAEPTASGFWSRLGRRIQRRPRATWIGTSLLLGVACLGLLTLNPTGLDTDHVFTKDVDSVTGQHVAEDHGLADSSNPVLVVARAAQADQVASAMTGIDHLEEPSPPVIKGDDALIAANIDVDAASQTAFDVVDDVRDRVHAVSGADALVGGNSALNADIQSASKHDDLVVTPVVLGVVLLVLIVLLRSLAAPLLLMGTVVLSFGSALGLSSLLSTQVLGFPTTDAQFPLFVFVFLVALGIDYNIFLMTRVREETMVRGTREGSLAALAATGGVITSAGVVLAGTFAALGALPLVFTAQLGIAVAIGVLLDTLIVRSVLVTALNLDLGSRIWWPSRLDRGPHTVEAPAGERLGETVR